MKPEILILDEPMAGLDPFGRDEILGNIKRLHKELGMTIILVSHSMEDISSIADKILVMNKGCVEMFDRVEKVFEKEKRLEEIGLSVPQLTKVFSRLDINVSKNIFNVKEGAEILISALEK